MAKTKQKTHKATKKILNVRNSGSITYKKSGGNHKTAKDSSKQTGTLTYKKGNGNHKTNKDSAKQVRQRRNKGVLGKGEASRLKSVI